MFKHLLLVEMLASSFNRKVSVNFHLFRVKLLMLHLFCTHINGRINKFLTLSNQTSRYKLMCIRIDVD